MKDSIGISRKLLGWHGPVQLKVDVLAAPRLKISAAAEGLELPSGRGVLGADKAQPAAGRRIDEPVTTVDGDVALSALGYAGSAKLKAVAIEKLDFAVGEDNRSLGGNGEDSIGLHI
ncbi:hypothetical protein CMEL01_02824 [Colletotrichum melonis]|uniref:Uncharacterized protein n=1 Tax=Colletotrichum melonis TaxID=1209925 RepID=A0AAI9UND9_9PEZI|nr:hypothetical protein CMEL01_02824 [Colletotrichum melonis]